MNETALDSGFEAMLRSELPTLRGVAYRILRNAADADEAVQEACISAWRRFGSFRGDAAFASWIYRITVNAAYGIFRKRRREHEKLERYAAEPPPPPPDEPDRRLAALENAIARLPETSRLAISIGVLSGIPASRAATILGCNENALYQRIHKAKQQLKSLLQEEHE